MWNLVYYRCFQFELLFSSIYFYFFYIFVSGIAFTSASYRQFIEVIRVITSDMADEKRININVAGVNIASEEKSSFLEIRKFHQSCLELPYEPKGINLDKNSLIKLINLSEELIRKIDT